MPTLRPSDLCYLKVLSTLVPSSLLPFRLPTNVANCVDSRGASVQTALRDHALTSSCQSLRGWTRSLATRFETCRNPVTILGPLWRQSRRSRRPQRSNPLNLRVRFKARDDRLDNHAPRGTLATRQSQITIESSPQDDEHGSTPFSGFSARSNSEAGSTAKSWYFYATYMAPFPSLQISFDICVKHKKARLICDKCGKDLFRTDYVKNHRCSREDFEC